MFKKKIKFLWILLKRKLIFVVLSLISLLKILLMKIMICWLIFVVNIN